MKYTNKQNLSLPIALWLTADDYDRKPMEDCYGVTELLKSLRQIVLGRRVVQDDSIIESVDVSDCIEARIGQTIHSAIEDSVLNNYTGKLLALGYPQAVIDRVRINPNEPCEDAINIYTEGRTYKQLDTGDIVSGKYDFVIEGVVNDIKTTKCYQYTKNDFREKAVLQGSMYRWLDPDVITEDHIYINWIFKDWAASQTFRDNYPKNQIVISKLHLMSLGDTDRWVRSVLTLVKSYKDTPEPELPECNSTELWRDAPVWKYYKDPAKLSRSTKNFANAHEANLRLAKEGKGIVLEVKGTAKACKYCNVFAICTQKDKLIASGDLVL